jgi:hypothetical protein
MLYEPERHEPLTATAWKEQAVRDCIDEILSDAIDRFSARDLWPSHPLDSFSPHARELVARPDAEIGQRALVAAAGLAASDAVRRR